MIVRRLRVIFGNHHLRWGQRFAIRSQEVLTLPGLKSETWGTRQLQHNEQRRYPRG
jgi:hypothetical protein